MENFIHLHFLCQTTSPWSIGRMYAEAPLICCQSFLWGRAVRGPILNYLLRTYCPYFPKLPSCEKCLEKSNCPFYNLYGADKRGELKDTPRLIVTSLTFKETFGKMEFDRFPLLSRDSMTNGVALGPIFIEYIPPRTNFEFEALLIGKASEFDDYFIEAVRATLSLTGWGARCSRGCGRGRILGNVRKHSFDKWVEDYIDKRVRDSSGLQEVSLRIFPILMLEKDKEVYYSSILEKGFLEKLRNSMQERYWQFFKRNHYLDIKSVSGPCTHTMIRAWSRKENREKWFSGLTGSIKIRFKSKLNEEDLRVIGVSWYGIGRFKNQGFGSLRLMSP